MARSRWLSAAATFAGAALLMGSTGLASAQVPSVADSKVLLHSTTDTNSFDIGWVDQSTGQYFLADRTNKAVDWFDVTTDPQHDRFVKYLGFGAFSGAGSSSAVGGPNGVVTDDQHRVWAGDGPDSTGVSSVKVIDPNTGAVQTIYNCGTKRADELSYDPVHQMVLIANDEEGFLTFFDVRTTSLAGQFYYADNTLGRAASVTDHATAGGGIEQSLYNPATGKFYQAVPGSKKTPGFIDVFDPLGKKLESTIAVPGCDGGPTGLVLDPRQRLIGACANGGVAIDVPTGNVIGIVPEVAGADELWFSDANQQIYFGRSGPGMLGVLDAAQDSFAQNLPTSGGSHSVAAFKNQILVPERKGDQGLGIRVFLKS
jgi:hypothetical protein